MENISGVALVKVINLLSKIKYWADEIADSQQLLEKFIWQYDLSLASGDLPGVGMANWAKGWG